jgi:hypothetical protein
LDAGFAFLQVSTRSLKIFRKNMEFTRAE